MYIVIEGADGVGKSTQLEMLTDYYEKQGREVVVVREPGTGDYGEGVRGLILENRNLNTTATLLAMYSVREEIMSSIIRPALSSGKVVLGDRCSLSSWAYQFHVDKCTSYENMNMLENIIHPTTTYLPMIILLEAPNVIRMDRLRKRGNMNHLDFKKGVEVGMRRYINRCSKAYKTINTSYGIEETHNRVVNAISNYSIELFNNKNGIKSIL